MCATMAYMINRSLAETTIMYKYTQKEANQ